MKYLVSITLFLFTAARLLAQPEPVFQNLNTANGLSYSVVNNVCTDARDGLWVSTGNGLNHFNGKTVDKYFATEHPQLQNSNVLHIAADGAGCIWALTAGGNVTVVDENRRLHRVGLYHSGTFLKTRWLQPTLRGMALLTEKGLYTFTRSRPLAQADSLSLADFSRLNVAGFDALASKRFAQVFSFDEHTGLVATDAELFKIDYARLALQRFAVPNCLALVKWEENTLLYVDKKGGPAKTFNFATGQTAFPFENLKDQQGAAVEAPFTCAARLGGNRFLFASFFRGLYLYDRTENKMYRYRHSLADPSTVATDHGSSIAVGKNGWAFVVCNPAGISYFNTNEFIGNKAVFVDGSGRGYDGYTAGIASADNDNYFIGTANGLLHWTRSTNTTRFFEPRAADGKPVLLNSEVRSIEVEANGDLWCTTTGNGLAVLDQNGNLRRQLRSGKDSAKFLTATRFATDAEGTVWATTWHGLLRLKGRQSLPLPEPLKKFDSTVLMSIRFLHGEMYIGTLTQGLFRYNPVTQVLDEVKAFAPYKAGGVVDMTIDPFGNLYVGNRQGLHIFLKNGGEKKLDAHNGLLLDVVEGLLTDDHGRIWIGNDIGLACYNPATGSLQTFDERYGLSVYGFRWTCYFKMPNGEFFFGLPKGIQYFHPDSLLRRQLRMNVAVTRTESATQAANTGANASFHLPAGDNSVTFSFGSVDYSPQLRTYYRYRLKGADKDWIYVADQTSVRYNALPPGHYVFQVAISNDNRNWQAADNEVKIQLAAHWFESGWARAGGALLALLMAITAVLFYRRRHYRREAELKVEAVINYFASRISSQRDADALLWDVARNCISRLKFEDCVIYLKDAERNVLVQKAAYGPKTTDEHTIQQPIEIPVGSGITGAVAKTGEAEIIGNTARDARYIVDDKRRSSEIAVPIIAEGTIVGVIDSEHTRKHFFNKRHLRILTTIAMLCANQLQKIKAEEEKQAAVIQSLENKRKATESRLQSLRLQMKPHFLFNALNSVQQMILANEDMVATEYLSKFSKLLRAILIHSDKESISLKEEIDILTLYIELESIRFKQSFRYTIVCDEDIDTEEVKIPALLVQPFVENAIWHGLMNKKGLRLLTVSFAERDDFIRCTVSDNGVGRSRSAASKPADGRKHVSKGIQVSEERLRAMKLRDGRTGALHIIDCFDGEGSPAGTTVEIDFPV